MQPAPQLLARRRKREDDEENPYETMRHEGLWDEYCRINGALQTVDRSRLSHESLTSSSELKSMASCIINGYATTTDLKEFYTLYLSLYNRGHNRDAIYKIKTYGHAVVMMRVPLLRELCAAALMNKHGAVEARMMIGNKISGFKDFYNNIRRCNGVDCCNDFRKIQCDILGCTAKSPHWTAEPLIDVVSWGFVLSSRMYRCIRCYLNDMKWNQFFIVGDQKESHFKSIKIPCSDISFH